MRNGVRQNFSKYLLSVAPSPFAPLTSIRDGRAFNVSLQGYEETTGRVHFYAPVFEGTEYRFAEPLHDYAAAFRAVAAQEQTGSETVFGYNCILNYLYGQMEGKPAGSVSGPITFGEIANGLHNQTLVRLMLADRALNPAKPTLVQGY